MDAEATRSSTNELFHEGIYCDECGESPIVGTRYLSKCVFDYDLCEICFREHAVGKEDDFVALRLPPHNSVGEAAQTLRPGIEEAYLRLHESVPVEQYEELQSALANSTDLKSLWLYMFDGHADFTGGIVCIARGIMNNQSIQKVGWAIPNDYRVNATPQVKLALSEMIQHNRVLKEIYFWAPTSKKTVDPAEDDFARSILDGLRFNCTLQIMRLDSFHVLSSSIRNRVVNLLNYNTKLKRLYVTFEEDLDYRLDLLFGEDNEYGAGSAGREDDYRLELLLARNRGQWLTRLTDTKSSTGDQKALVLEALEAMPVNASVPTLHYLLQNFPMLMNDLQPILP